MNWYPVQTTILNFFNLLAIGYFVILNTIYLITSIIAFFSLRNYARQIKAIDLEELISTAGAPPVTLIAPAYNEEATCVESAKSLILLKYPEYEILMVNDGSQDGTVDRMISAYDMVPTPRGTTANLKTANVRGIYRSRMFDNLWLIDKENGGKADALNTGINYCRTPLFCGMDSDSILERDALIRIVRPFMENANTVAVGGIIRIVNGCEIEGGSVSKVGLPKNILARLQVLEYLRSFMAGRMGWDALDLTLIISGAFGVFKRSIVIDVGGYRTDTVGEDMELIVRLHRYCRSRNIDYRIAYVADPVAWTECPETLGDLGRQRNRWQRGLYETMMRHITMFGNPRYGRIGLVAVPYFFILELLGPILELLGFLSFFISIIFARISGPYMMVFFMTAFVFGVVLSIAAVALEELTFHRYPRVSDLLKLFVMAVVENFGYRQLNSYWRFKGVIMGMRGVSGWGKMTRKGFKQAAT